MYFAQGATFSFLDREHGEFSLIVLESEAYWYHLELLNWHENVHDRFWGSTVQLFSEIGVGLEAKLAQHIPLLVVIAQRLYWFYVILIEVYYFSYSVHSLLFERDH